MLCKFCVSSSFFVPFLPYTAYTSIIFCNVETENDKKISINDSFFYMHLASWPLVVGIIHKLQCCFMSHSIMIAGEGGRGSERQSRARPMTAPFHHVAGKLLLSPSFAMVYVNHMTFFHLVEARIGVNDGSWNDVFHTGFNILRVLFSA